MLLPTVDDSNENSMQPSLEYPEYVQCEYMNIVLLPITFVEDVTSRTSSDMESSEYDEIQHVSFS